MVDLSGSDSYVFTNGREFEENSERISEVEFSDPNGSETDDDM